MPTSETSSSRPGSGWSLTYPGFRLAGCYNPSKTVYTVTVTPPGKSDIPDFEIRLQGLRSMTHVLLPGSTTLLQISDKEEVGVRMAGKGQEVERVDAWFRRVVQADEFVSAVKEVYRGDVCVVEARGAVAEDIDEAFVVLSCFKFCMDGEPYERILDGL